MPPAESAPLRNGPSRRIPLWLWTLAVVFLVARVGTGLYEERHPVEVEDRVGWVLPERAERLARETGKPILYDFSAAWCGPCREMKKDLFADRRLAEQIDEWFVPVRVVDRVQEEGRNPPVITELQNRYAIDAFPTLVVAYRDTTPPQRLVGYPGEEMTMQWLREAQAGRVSEAGRLLSGSRENRPEALPVP